MVEGNLVTERATDIEEETAKKRGEVGLLLRVHRNCFTFRNPALSPSLAQNELRRRQSQTQKCQGRTAQGERPGHISKQFRTQKRAKVGSEPCDFKEALNLHGHTTTHSRSTVTQSQILKEAAFHPLAHGPLVQRREQCVKAIFTAISPQSEATLNSDSHASMLADRDHLTPDRICHELSPSNLCSDKQHKRQVLELDCVWQ